MCKVVFLKSSDLFTFINKVLTKGQTARITVTGQSMYPFLRDCQDSVGLASETYQNILRGDIVLIRRDNGEYVLHRVIRKCTDTFYIIGDGQVRVEGPLKSSQLIAKVRTVWRGEHEIDCTGALWKLLSHIWLYCLPLRRIKIKTKSLLKKIIRILYHLTYCYLFELQCNWKS